MGYTKPSSNDIEGLITVISNIQDEFWEIGEKTRNPMLALQNNQMLDMFKNVLFFGWEKYEYGWHSDFWEEGDSMIGYMMFELEADKIITDLIEVLVTESPFRMLEVDGKITSSLISVYRAILQDLRTGNFTIL